MIWHPSPNFGARRGGARPSLVVLHYTAMQGAQAALARLCDPSAEVSAHYLISNTGQIWHMVDEANRAWHAGAGRWGAMCDVNSHSIGIELDNTGAHPFAHDQMLALCQLLGGILQRWQIPAQGVIGHSDMAPTRKQDPGAKFDWQGLARQGLAIWPGPWPASMHSPVADMAAFRADCARFGYDGSPDIPDTAVLAAFRLRFRPWATGPLATIDCAQAADLAQRFPVDRRAASA